MIPRPPQLEELPAGTKLRAGLGTATILADFDFETYSEAGFYFDESAQRYLPPPNSKVKGLPTIGVAAYAMHPSTEIISMAYDLKDGRGKRIWKPGEPPPIDLFLHIRNGGLLEAWNSPFEWWVWNFACTRRYGWPELPLHQMRDAAAKARAFALPSSLGNAGEVMNITNKKIEDGKRLINLFSMPRNPTKNNPARRIAVTDRPEDAALFYAYNLKDIEAEAELSSKIPDLTDNELQFWLCDQAINARGVQLDLPTIKNCIAIVEQAHAKYNQELYQITGGAVRYASEVAKLKAWLKTRNVSVHSLDAENLEILLGLKLDVDIHRALRIRELIGSAAVKKLYAMINTVSPRGRLHELFLYHGARTGRAAGRGAQPQNLPNSGIETTQCWMCDRHYVGGQICTWCGKYSQGSTVECSPAVIENIVEVINTGSLECVEMFYGNAVDAVSSCLRGMFVSAPGKDLICSDYSAIEAVVLAELAGESWRQEVFRTHGCIYEMSASKITGTPFDEYMRYKKDNKKHHPDRKIGKVAELACFASDTQVLTQRGYVDIVAVTLNDKLWDGIEWVAHSGMVHKGKKNVITLDGVKMTPSHPVYVNGSWKRASQLASNGNILDQALANGSANLPIWVNGQTDHKKATSLPIADVNAGTSQPRPIATYAMAGLRDVTYALKKLASALTLFTSKIIGSMNTSYLTLAIDDGWGIGYRLPSVDATAPQIAPMLITAGEVSLFVSYGEKIEPLSTSMLQPLKAGITKCWKWIGLIAIKATNPATLDSYQNSPINSTKEKLTICNQKYKNLKDVYDIVNAGSRNRFTIKTKSGHLIVHNSGYQGWIGAWKNFKADEFLSEEQIKQAILAWRKASPAIVEFWGGQYRGHFPDFYGLEGAAIQSVMQPGVEFKYRAISYITVQDVLYCKLPSGRNITYHRPMLRHSDRRPGTMALSFEGWNSNPIAGRIGWVRMDTYGGKLTENVVQAVARDLLAHAIVNLEREGYSVVLHVHDEIVSEIPEGWGSIHSFEAIMSSMPIWAYGWPVKAKGGWRAKRYAK